MSPDVRSAADLVAAAIGARLAGSEEWPLVVGICGAQGSGKTTLCDHVETALSDSGLHATTLSLDDLYLTRAGRRRLARDVHPLLQTRGVPGTHDLGLGLDVLWRLSEPGIVAMPRFDKATDERRPERDWPRVEGPMDVVLFEGWCVGARPQSTSALAAPVNDREAREDGDRVWRDYVNRALAGDYRRLFEQIGLLVLLAAPDFTIVRRWRGQQERGLKGPRVMNEAALDRFVQLYERITRHILTEMPGRADLVIRLDADRAVTSWQASPA